MPNVTIYLFVKFLKQMFQETNLKSIARAYVPVTNSFTAIFSCIVFILHKTDSAAENCIEYNNICYNKP